MALVKDVVCGMDVDPETAAAKSEHGGTTYYFCSEGCKLEFDANPGKFLNGGSAPAEQPQPTPAAASTGEQPSKRWWEFWK
jgi:Cu+-exporting ATPase